MALITTKAATATTATTATSINTSALPVGAALQVVDSGLSSGTTTINASSNESIASLNLVKKATNSTFIIQVQATIVRPATSGWHRLGVTATGGFSSVQDVKDDNSWATQTILIKTDSISGNIGDTITFNSYNTNTAGHNDQIRNVRVTVMEFAR